MTQVDFYTIPDSNPQAENEVACRLAEKALDQGYRILILGHDNSQLHDLDEKLWTFKEQSFIPHEIVQNDSSVHEQVKVVLSSNVQANKNANLLINLSGQMPSDYSNFERIVEIVPALQHERHQSRLRYKQYRENNCELKTHKL